MEKLCWRLSSGVALLELTEAALETSKPTWGTELCSYWQKIQRSVTELRGDFTLPISLSLLSQSFISCVFLQSGSLVFQGSTWEPSTQELRRHHSWNNPLLSFSCCLIPLLGTYLVCSPVSCLSTTEKTKERRKTTPRKKGETERIFFFFGLE